MVRTSVGYSGGTTKAPTYKNIGDHSEVIQVEFDPKQISYAELLEVFWASHDASYDSFLRQYRNAVFYLTEDQKKISEDAKARVAAKIPGKMQTVIEPAGPFYAAEEYHQKYLMRKAKGIMQELQAIYPDVESFTASTAVARINGYLGCYGDPKELQKELQQLGLSWAMQALLVEHVTTSCDGFASVTCPAPKR